MRLDFYPPMAKKDRDPKELFANLSGSNILDEAAPEESALWAMTKSARLMVPLTNMSFHHSTCMYQKAACVPHTALQITRAWSWHHMHPGSLCFSTGVQTCDP